MAQAITLSLPECHEAPMFTVANKNLQAVWTNTDISELNLSNTFFLSQGMNTVSLAFLGLPTKSYQFDYSDLEGWDTAWSFDLTQAFNWQHQKVQSTSAYFALKLGDFEALSIVLSGEFKP